MQKWGREVTELLPKVCWPVSNSWSLDSRPGSHFPSQCFNYLLTSNMLSGPWWNWWFCSWTPSWLLSYISSFQFSSPRSLILEETQIWPQQTSVEHLLCNELCWLCTDSGKGRGNKICLVMKPKRRTGTRSSWCSCRLAEKLGGVILLQTEALAGFDYLLWSRLRSSTTKVVQKFSEVTTSTRRQGWPHTPSYASACISCANILLAIASHMVKPSLICPLGKDSLSPVFTVHLALKW